MRRILYIMILLLAVFITSCDRFKHTFEPENTVDIGSVLINPMQNAFDGITATDVSGVMAFYSSEYLHNGQTKANRAQFFTSLFQRADTLHFSVTLLNSDAIASGDTISTVSWRLQVSNGVNQALADSTFTDEKIIKTGNSWLLYGNQLSGDSVDFETVLFTPLQTAFNNITSTDVSAVMDFYDEEYLHNGQEKADREDFLLGLSQKDGNLNFEVTLISAQAVSESDTLSIANWRLKVTNQAEQVVADSTFYGEELIKRGNNWLLYGNRVGCCPPVTYKQRVFIETFTYTTCPNCPIVEALLHQLQQAHPNNLTYLEYHINDPLDMGNSDVFGYYGYPAMPCVVFQGETKIIGNNADNEVIFNQLVNQIANTDSKIDLSNLNYNFAGQTLTGNVRIAINDQAIDTSQLKLKYAIIDKETNPLVYHNSQDGPCRNVVLAKGTKSLLDADLSQPVNFNLPFSTLPSGYTGSLPVDSYLVLWVQTTPDPFNANAVIYNGIESPITVNKHRSK